MNQFTQRVNKLFSRSFNFDDTKLSKDANRIFADLRKTFNIPEVIVAISKDESLTSADDSYSTYEEEGNDKRSLITIYVNLRYVNNYNILAIVLREFIKYVSVDSNGFFSKKKLFTYMYRDLCNRYKVPPIVITDEFMKKNDEKLRSHPAFKNFSFYRLANTPLYKI